MEVAVMVVDGMFDSGLTSILDVLSTANALRRHVRDAPEPFEVTLLGLSDTARTGHNHIVSTTPLASVGRCPDLLVLPALGLRSPDDIIDVVRSPQHDGVRWFMGAARAGGCALAGACSGTFFIAESGLLDGRSATTCWWLGPAFRQRYPAVELDESRTLAHDWGITTAGAAFAHVDMALSIVQQQSPALAEVVGKYLLIGERPPQSAYATPTLLANADPTMALFEQWVREHMTNPELTVSDVAQLVGVNERSLQRTATAVVGMSAAEFIQEVRLDEATFLLRTTMLDLSEIAVRVGMRDPVQLRTALRRRRGVSPDVIRQRTVFSR